MPSVSEGLPLAIQLLTKLVNEGGNASIDALLKRPLYSLSDTTTARPMELITTVSPIIRLAENKIITSLQKPPSDIHRLSPRQFEILLADLLTDMGWEVELTKQTRDGGADILAYFNSDLGRFLCLVEAKHYREDRKIGVYLVRTLYGTLFDAQASSAMLVTSSTFTKDAREFQQKHEYQLTLREYADIVDWLSKYGNRKSKYH